MRREFESGVYGRCGSPRGMQALQEAQERKKMQGVAGNAGSRRN